MFGLRRIPRSKPNNSHIAKRQLRIITDSLLLEPAGGVERSTLENSIGLAERGHRVSVLYGSDGSLGSHYDKAGIQLHGPVAFRFDKRHPVDSFLNFREPAKWARGVQPDVLWLNRFENIQCAQEIATWSDCPIVCQLHHLPSPGRESILRHNVAHFVAVSEFMKSAWVDAGIPKKRISVIANSLPAGTYPYGGLEARVIARKSLDLPLGPVIVLCYGRMIEEKGIGTLLEAWSKLRLDPDEALLVLVGSPSLTPVPAVEEALRLLSPTSYRWYPMQSDMDSFLHAADLVVFPTWLNEGFGRVIIEGMNSGRPVIASRVGATPEILSGPMSRFLVEPRNSDELGRLMLSLLHWRRSDPDLGSQCAAWVEARYRFADNNSAFEGVLLQFARRARN
ncbi:MAG: glycosyltransferase family 4 protein [Acidobacteria bacterium]|nr:glycosyltransferase family 4 protein [Acidobacteriota bacterium]